MTLALRNIIGEKQCVTAVGRYILVGSMDVKTRSVIVSKSVSRGKMNEFHSILSGFICRRVLVTIYDLRNKFISMSHLLGIADKRHIIIQYLRFVCVFN